ncbi:MAG: DUF1566 domain-containing protein [Pseudomonadota bacterium]
MMRHLSPLLVSLLALTVGAQAQAACTAANANANTAESTASSAFTVNAAAGTVTHSLTGLTWKQCSQGQSGAACATGAASTMSWGAALASAAADATDGGGWRLPNQKELESIVESCGSAPAINQTVFPAAAAANYWSGSTFVATPANARLVDFNSGATSHAVKSGSNAVRLVRGGQTYDAFDAQLDTIPNAISFTEQTSVALGSENTSNTVTIAGINSASPISISGGTYSKNGGSYTATAGTVISGDTVAVKLTASSQGGTVTFAMLTVGGINGVFKVTTVTASGTPQSAPPLLSITIPGATSLPSIVNLNASGGPNLTGLVTSQLASVLGSALQFVEQSAQGTVTLSGYQGGNLAFMPVAFQTSDGRANGIYSVGNGQYQVVSGGQSMTIAPALVHLDQLLALLPGAVASVADNGVIVASYNGVLYSVQPSVAVGTSVGTGSARLLFGNDGYHHFIDAQGNGQILYPAFADVATLRSLVPSMFPGATSSIQLGATALVTLNGQSFSLVPDITLGGVPAERAGQPWWQESATRYRLVNTQVPAAAGTSQGFTKP